MTAALRGPGYGNMSSGQEELFELLRYSFPCEMLGECSATPRPKTFCPIAVLSQVDYGLRYRLGVALRN